MTTDQDTGQGPEAPSTDPAPAKRSKGVGEPVPAPKDAPEETRTGYAVYDRTLGRYVSEVTPGKPSAKDARAAAKGHPHTIVAV